MENITSRLVPKRECGLCTACCKWLPIDTEELQKHARVLCKNHGDHGCQIYETRPGVCRNWYCGWRMMPNLDDDWRPDKSGIIVEFKPNDIPEHYELREGIKFFIIGSHQSIFRRGFAEMIGACVEARVPTFISIPGPFGHFPAKAFLNDAINSAVVERDRDKVLSVIIGALEGLTGFKLDRVMFRNGALPPE